MSDVDDVLKDKNVMKIMDDIKAEEDEEVEEKKTEDEKKSLGQVWKDEFKSGVKKKPARMKVVDDWKPKKE